MLQEITSLLTTLNDVLERENNLVREYFERFPSEVRFKYDDRPTIKVHVGTVTEKAEVVSMNKDGLVCTDGINDFGCGWENVCSPYKLKLMSYVICGTL